MRLFHIAILISLVFHAAIFAFCYYYILPQEMPVATEISFLPAVVPLNDEPPHAARHARATAKIALPSASVSQIQPESQPQAEETVAVTPADTLQPSAATASISYFAPQSYSASYFQRDSLHQSRWDSLRQIMLTRTALAPYAGPTSSYDRVESDLYRRNMGQTAPIPVGSLVGAATQALKSLASKEKPKPVRLTRAPTQIELAALCAIWQKDEPTQNEIYASMDANLPLTAHDLDLILERMTEKGFLSRTMISPRDEFTFITPMGPVGVEKSALNRLNRVYRYKSRVDRNLMMNYLQARLYEQRGKAFGDSTRILQRLIMRMVK